MNLAMLGFAMVASFIALIVSKRLSAVVALILIPLIFGAFAGHGTDLGAMMIDGVRAVAPTALMLTFAIL
ncbi:MAG: citrate transporter, partial [Caulobacterales bacterium]